ALSVQDVRDRPLEAQQQADQAHAKFDDEKSEFSGYLRLWKWLADARGGAPVALTRRQMGTQESPGPRAPRNLAALPVAQRSVQAAPVVPVVVPAGAAAPAPQHKLSNRQYEQLLRQNFISIRRVREWRDIHSQLLTVVNDQKWVFNRQPAGYDELHKAMLSGLLGNIGFKPDDEDLYLGARGIKFHRHPGAHLSKKPGRWIVAAELVETTRLFGRGIANIEPQWLEEVGGHLLKKQLLDPHWEKRSAEVVALERATLYGLVVYNNRRRPFGHIDPQGAREIFLRSALVGDEWETKLPFLAANRRTIRQVEELEHKARRQDVLVDDEFIYAFYDKQVPQEIATGRDFERWYREASQGNPELLVLTRDALMRHEAAGITGSAFPRTVKLGGVDCSATYLHAPGDAKDGVSVTVPIFVLNQVSEDRAEWLVPGMLKDKIQALLKSLPQKPRARLVPLPESATRIAEALTAPEAFGHGALLDALVRQVREITQLDVKRADFKPDMLPPHLFMHFRVTDEHGRQRGAGRSLAALKAELGAQARGAFQALAALRVAGAPASEAKAAPAPAAPAQEAIKKGASRGAAPAPAPAPSAAPAEQRYTDWTFGALPELMEIRKGGQTLVGFPALVDAGDAVRIEVFDEPEAAAARHRAGLRRLFALQIRDALKYLEKNLPDLQKMAVAFMPLGTQDELRQQILDLAIDRAFLLDPLPTDAEAFRQRLAEGRARLTLIANEVARLASRILGDYATAVRKIKDTRGQSDAVADVQHQLQRLVGKTFLATTPWAQLQHLPRYLQGIVLRLDKLRADPARDAQRMAELRPQEQRYWRLVAERKGQVDARMQEQRWLLEELRISFFAQELRTPAPVSIKRLDKAWALMNA
uniref:DUF3418 domain-containing protein n=1 Tax=uncultured Xylophilus sp. TaxID=296832 RepID=UPI0025E6A953